MKLIILDRDGVINYDSPHYIKTPSEWQPIPGSLTAIAKLAMAGYRIAVATNQSGIARGLYSHDMLDQIHQKMLGMTHEFGGEIHYIAYCPHHPADHCGCRKPQTGLLDEIADHFAVSLQGVPLVGDKITDLQAANAVHAKGMLVTSGYQTLDTAQGKAMGGLIYPDLASVADALLHEAG